MRVRVMRPVVLAAPPAEAFLDRLVVEERERATSLSDDARIGVPQPFAFPAEDAAAVSSRGVAEQLLREGDEISLGRCDLHDQLLWQLLLRFTEAHPPVARRQVHHVPAWRARP